MNKIISTVLTMAALLASTTASAVLIDFEGQMPGDVVTGLTIDGATFSVTDQGTTGGNPRDLMIFNSNCGGMLTACTGGDADLSTTTVPMGVDPISAGNILIISQDNNAMNPNDSSAGGTISMKLNTQATAFSAVTVDVGDSDVGPNFFEAFLNDVSVGLFLFLAIGQSDNNVQQVGFSDILFDEIRLTLAGSGGLASVDFTPVPLPAALPLFMAGLLGLFGLRRKSLA